MLFYGCAKIPPKLVRNSGEGGPEIPAFTFAPMKSPVPRVACVSSSYSAPFHIGGLVKSAARSVRPALFSVVILRGGGTTNNSPVPVHPHADSSFVSPVDVVDDSNIVGSTASTTTNVHGGGADIITSTLTSSSFMLGPNSAPPGALRRLLPGFPRHVVPNYLTYVRCLSITIFLLLSYYPATFPDRAPTLSIIFALASITDWFDGYLAWRWDIASNFGAFLDPVADKLMVSTALISLAGRYGGIVAIPASIIMAREVGVSALREWMVQKGQRDSVKVGIQGKVKAAITMVSLTVMLLVPEGVGLESVSWARYLGLLGVGGAGQVV
jgi:CDP-diacylglycerol--glycerol-3-phosphate 3-phosphatidyltransferase